MPLRSNAIEFTVRTAPHSHEGFTKKEPPSLSKVTWKMSEGNRRSSSGLDRSSWNQNPFFIFYMITNIIIYCSLFIPVENMICNKRIQPE